MSFCLFELARNSEIQRKVQAEIDEVLDGDESFSYESLSKLKYLECCIDETLRKYPIVPQLIRTATKDYTFDGYDQTIPKGTAICIPVLGIQRDPEIYDNPMDFIPERFLDSPHGGGKASGSFYMPFGDGPRNCIGIRLGKLTTKIGLALILRKFNVEHTNEEFLKNEVKFSPSQPLLIPEKSFKFKISSRN
jgi:cytochrome P450 family 6